MLGKLLRGARRRIDLRLFLVFCAVTSLCPSLPEAAGPPPPPPLRQRGLRWIGVAPASSTPPVCAAPSSWSATPLFRTPGLPAALARLCAYAWTDRGKAAPDATDLGQLFATSGATEMTEDVPVVLQMFSSEETALFTGLRNALRAQVGSASLLSAMPDGPRVRVAVIDTAPDAPAGYIAPGQSRHGDTLAHLIEDLVCRPVDNGPDRTCAAEVTTVLAMPGGAGTLSELSRAIERAVATWVNDRRAAPRTTPTRLILNLSLGWEDTPGIADCTTESSRIVAPPARAVRGILQYATSQGALVIAAAGNDVGGPTPRTGLVCPARYQALPRDGDATQSLVLAVSGVDYQDHPLETARPAGITGIAGLGLGGVAWGPNDSVPPQLTGSSVSTAAVSAVSALVWAARPTWTTREVTQTVYAGGVDVGTANECPRSLEHCRSRRTSACGALTVAGAAVPCAAPPAQPGSSPVLTSEIAALTAAFGGLSPTSGTLTATVDPLPRYSAPTVQLQPWTAPMPIAETCPVCVLANGMLTIPPRPDDLEHAVLVVELADGTVQTLALTPSTLASNTPYVFSLPPNPSAPPIQAAYITAFGEVAPSLPAYSITEQVFVDP
jgi:Subtilase family